MKAHWLIPGSPSQAVESQREMAQSVVIKDDFVTPIRYIAGVDISNNRFDPKKLIYAAIVVLEYPSMKVVETVTSVKRQDFPYITGLLGFREAPILVETYQKLTTRPDLIMVDGHGISHPRGLGVASHLGVLLNVTTIGVAKSLLVGSPAKTLQETAGSQEALLWKGNVLGMHVRTKNRCSPLIISAGHRITLETAIALTLSCVRGYRLPEPTRQAHLAANHCRRMSLQLDSNPTSTLFATLPEQTV